MVRYTFILPPTQDSLADNLKGPFVRIAPAEVAVSDIEAVQQIHKIGSPFTKSAWYQNQSPTQTTDDTCGVFGIRDAVKARERRRYFQLAGTKPTVTKWEPMIVDIIDLAVSKIKRDAMQGKAVRNFHTLDRAAQSALVPASLIHCLNANKRTGYCKVVHNDGGGCDRFFGVG